MSSIAVADAPSEAPTDMWSASPVIQWLILEGWRIESIPDLLEALAGRLCDDGVPLWRLFCLVPTLHPSISAAGISGSVAIRRCSRVTANTGRATIRSFSTTR